MKEERECAHEYNKGIESLASPCAWRYNGLPIGKGSGSLVHGRRHVCRHFLPEWQKQGKEIVRKEELAKESIELLGDIKESIEEVLCVVRSVRVSAETASEDISLIRGMGAVEKLLKHAKEHELAELEAVLLELHGQGVFTGLDS